MLWGERAGWKDGVEDLSSHEQYTVEPHYLWILFANSIYLLKLICNLAWFS